MEQPTYVKKKLVTVRCSTPFSYKKIPFVGICNKIVIEVDAIAYALTRKAKVVEHLKNGKEVPLGFDNYNTYNGPTEIDETTALFEYSEPEIEMIDGFGNRSIINKKKSDPPVIKHIDLEAERKRQKEEEEKKKTLELQKQKQAEADRKAAERQAMKERDQKAKEEAAAKILEEAKANTSGTNDNNSKEFYIYDFPGSISTPPETDFTNSDRQESKKITYDGKKDKKK